jgi:hypothetical protein
VNPLTLLGLVGDQLFLVGVGAGLVGLAVVLATRGRVGWFLAWACATALGLWWTGWIGGTFGAVPWATLLAIAAVVTATLGTMSLRRRVPSWAIGALFALSVLGIWGTIPETGAARVLLGATAGMLPAFWPLDRARVDAFGCALALTVCAAVTVDDGSTRPGAIVGALGAFGMLVLAPLLLRIAKEPDGAIPGGPVVGAQIVLVMLSGRLAGRLASPTMAGLVWVGAALATGVVWAWAERYRARTAD